MGDGFTVRPIGFIRSPYRSKGDAPEQGRFSGQVCEIELLPEFEAGLKDIETCSHLIVIYWLDRARRDVLLTPTPHDDHVHGVFSTRSPNRPNPLGFAVVELKGREGRRLWVVGLDALDGTPLIDLKPYSADIDSVPEARIGWFEEARKRREGKCGRSFPAS